MTVFFIILGVNASFFFLWAKLMIADTRLEHLLKGLHMSDIQIKANNQLKQSYNSNNSSQVQ